MSSVQNGTDAKYIITWYRTLSTNVTQENELDILHTVKARHNARFCPIAARNSCQPHLHTARCKLI